MMFWRTILTNLDPAAVEAVSRRAVRVPLRAGETLFGAGDSADGMHLIDTGDVLEQNNQVRGAPVALQLRGPGDVLGAEGVSGHAPARRTTATAFRDGHTLFVSRALFDDLQTVTPALSALVGQVLEDALTDASEQLAEAVHATADDRIRRRLAVLATAHDGSVRMSQESLANLAGTTRPTVNRVLQDLQARDVIRIRRARVDIIDLTGLDVGGTAIVQPGERLTD